jgi:hypothetical protein
MENEEYNRIVEDLHPQDCECDECEERMFEEDHNALVEELSEAFDRDIEQTVEPYKSIHIKNRDMIIKIAALVHREGVTKLPANFLFTIINTMLIEKK